MRPRTPVTLWRHTLWELFKLIAITAIALVVIIAFAAGVRWVAEGKLGALELLRFSALASVPMLAYALPFAAGFGATLTFHRMAQDNEVSAAHAGGMSHSTVFVPAIAAGLTLATALAVLNEQIIPRFLRNMEEMVTEDLTKVMLAGINAGQAVDLGRTKVFADGAIEQHPELNEAVAATGAIKWLRMSNFFALLENDRGETTGMASAQEAHIFVYPTETTVSSGASAETTRGEAVVLLVSGVAETNGRYARFDEHSLPRIAIPYAFSDDPKFLTFGELRALREYPERMHFVETRRRTLIESLARLQTSRRIQTQLRDNGRIALLTPEGGRLVLRAADITFDEPSQGFIIEPTSGNGAILIDELAPEGTGRDPVVNREARAAVLRLGATRSGAPGPIPVANIPGLPLELELTDVSTGPGSAAGDRKRVVLTGLALPGDPYTEMLTMSPDELIALDTQIRGEGQSREARDLERRIERLGREITSKQHERAAMAISCLVMVLCGAVTALRLGASGTASTPLAVYLWSFFPALGSIVSIASGQRLVHDEGVIGLLALWGGVLGLAVYTLMVYRAVKRH
ncbi:MAG: LptF/LptG family permease [Planctomycetota bacterium]